MFLSTNLLYFYLYLRETIFLSLFCYQNAIKKTEGVILIVNKVKGKILEDYLMNLDQIQYKK